MHTSLMHDTFPIYFDKMVMDFGRGMFFAVKNRIIQCTSQLAELVIDMVPLENTVTQKPSLSVLTDTVDVPEGLRIAFNLQKPRFSNLQKLGMQMLCTLKTSLIEYLFLI